MDFPREVWEIIEFLERIQKNDVRDLEIAKKSREKYLEISQNAEKFSSSEEFKQFFDAEIENFFSKIWYIQPRIKEF